MYIIDKSNNDQHEYPTYGRQFNTYKWYKPLILGVVMGIIYLIFSVVLMFALIGDRGSMHISYENLNFTDLKMACYILGSMAVAIPALFIAAAIVRDRPFSSYTSARGGWNMKVFLIGLLVAAVVSLLPRMYLLLKSGGLKPTVEITPVTFLVILVVGSLQCIAEEYLFRGMFMQTIGSWIKVPLLAVLLQSIIFVYGHMYDIYGLLSVFISGIGFGAVAWFTRGIEVSSALHIMNNVPIFFMVGAGMGSIGGTANMATVIYSAGVYGVFVLIIWILKKKTHLFDEVRKDDLAEWNKRHSK